MQKTLKIALIFFFLTIGSFSYAQNIPVKIVAKEDCLTPMLLTAKNLGNKKVELRWTMAGPPAENYRVQYRKKGSDVDWDSQNSYTTYAILTKLAKDTKYEYRVGIKCGTDTNGYAYSQTQYFETDSKTEPDPNVQCGIAPTVDLSNQEPLQTPLGVNETFMAGDFPVTVIQATGTGTYSGEGYIEVPYLGNTKLKVVFNNIQLNTDRQLIAGVVETTYDAKEGNVVDAGDVLNELVTLLTTIDELIDTVKGGGTLSQTDIDKLTESIDKTKDKDSTTTNPSQEDQALAETIDKVKEHCTEKEKNEGGKQSFEANLPWTDKAKCVESLEELKKDLDGKKEEESKLVNSIDNELEKLDTEKIDKAKNIIFFVNGHHSIWLPGPSKGGKEYWNYFDNGKDTHQSEYLNYFNLKQKQTEIIYVDGSSIIAFDKDFKDRFKLGEKYIKQLLEKHKNITQKNITLVGHSEGVAYGTGIVDKLVENKAKVKEAIYLSCDECAEDGAKTNSSVPTYQIEYMYFEKSFPDGNCEEEFDKVVGTNLRFKTYNGLKGVTKFGIAIQNDLDATTVHGSSAAPEIIKFLIDLKTVSYSSYWNEDGKIFYKHSKTSNNSKFYKLNDVLIFENHPQFNEKTGKIDEKLPCKN